MILVLSYSNTCTFTNRSIINKSRDMVTSQYNGRDLSDPTPGKGDVRLGAGNNCDCLGRSYLPLNHENEHSAVGETLPTSNGERVGGGGVGKKILFLPYRFLLCLSTG